MRDGYFRKTYNQTPIFRVAWSSTGYPGASESDDESDVEILAKYKSASFTASVPAEVCWELPISKFARPWVTVGLGTDGPSSGNTLFIHSEW